MAPSPIRLRVSAAAEKRLRQGHPWVYADSIRSQNREGTTGDLAVIYDRRDRFLVLGLYDASSPLRVRILHRGKPCTLNEAWWTGHFTDAMDRRHGLLTDETTGCRLIHGENDDWPGLVLDRYEDTLVLKLYSLAWFPLLPRLLGILNRVRPSSRVVLRLSRNIQDQALANHGCRDGQVLCGEPLDGPVLFQENAIRFEADVLRGQKTGFFLDQRDNRAFVETLSTGADVLNAFSFSGGFSLYAARGGARSVLSMDISAHALAGASRNWQLNMNHPAVANCRHETVQADVFAWLATAPPQTFDLVIVDPPSLARRAAEREGALKAYAQLARQGMRRVRRGGVLVAASCSAQISKETFFSVVRDQAKQSGLSWQTLRASTHPSDHPATFPEAHYLKCLVMKRA